MALSVLERKARTQRRAIEKLGKDLFVGTGQAAEICGVKKPNLGRLRDSGRLCPIAELPSGPIFLRAEAVVVARELKRERKAREAA